MTKEKLKELAGSIKKFHDNIQKSKTRPRSLENSLLTKQTLAGHIKEYKSILLSLQHKLNVNDWNLQVELYQNLKRDCEEAIKILDNTPILDTTKPRIKFKTLGKTVILCKRLTSSFDTTLKKRPVITLKLLTRLIILCRRLTKRTKMPKVDIKLGTSLVAIYDGTPENLSAFLDAVTLFSDTVEGEFQEATAAQKTAATETVTKFIKTRITGAARQAITGTANLQQILDKLKTQFSPKINSDNIKTKLEALKQKGTLEEFCENVEKLTLRLASSYINEEIPIEKANQMAKKAGIDTLVKGVTNNATRNILQAGNFSAIHEATQKALEWDNFKSPNNTQAQVFTTRGYHQQRGRGRGKQNSNRGYNNPPNHSNRQNNGWQNYRQPQNFQTNNRFQQNGQYHNRGRFGTQRYYNQPQQQQMYLANASIPNQQQQGVHLIQQPNTNAQQQIQMQQNNSNFLGGQFGPRIQ